MVPLRDEKINKRLRDYYDILYNDNSNQDIGEHAIQFENMNRNFIHKISGDEVKEALNRMKLTKVASLDGILVEVLRYLWEMRMR